MRLSNRSALVLMTRLLVALFVLTACRSTHAAAALPPVRTVALSGDAPTGLPDSLGFTRFDSEPVIDGQGRVAFLAVAGVGFELSSVWAESEAGLRSVAQAGTIAPNTSANFKEFADLVVTDQGIVGFKARLAGPTINVENAESIWIDRDGALALVARGGAEAPDPTKDRRFLRFESQAAVNGDGQVAFFARTRDKELEVVQDSGFYASDGVELASIATAAGGAIVSEPGVIFSAQSFETPFADDPVVNAAGTTIFRGFIEGPDVNETNLNGLWRFNPNDGLQLLLRGGDEVPGIPGATFVSFPAIPTINAAGDSSFLAFYHPAEHASEHQESEIHSGLWIRRSSGALESIFLLGDDAPGIAGDAEFVDVFDPVMNGAGRVAILAAIAGDAATPTSEVGLWSSGLSADGTMELVARQGDVAPGGNGTIFGVFLEPSMNAVGQTAFIATGYDSAVEWGFSQSVGIWGEDCHGVLRLVIESGQLLEVAPGDFRQVAGVSFASESGGQDGKARGFNDGGQLAFHATFVDGSSGVFVSSVLAVPEPRAWSLFLGAVAIRWRRSMDVPGNARSFA